MCKCYGPYVHGRQFRLIVREQDGTRDVKDFGTKEEAEAVKNALLLKQGCVTMGHLFEKYEHFLRARGNKDSSIGTTLMRLHGWFQSGDPITGVNRLSVQAAYNKRVAKVKPGTHRHELREVKTFFRWAKKNGYIRQSPAEEIEGVGRIGHGKKQLRLHEYKSLYDLCTQRSPEDEGALAVLTVMTLGLRAGEVLGLCKNDIDVSRNAALLWVDSGKTDAARRFMRIPEPLATLLVARCSKVSVKLFDQDKDWLRRQLHGLCSMLGITNVCPHGLRGTWATLAAEMSGVAFEIAKHLGHTSFEITKRHYAESGSVERGMANNVLRLVA